MHLALAQVGAPLVAQFLEYGAVGLLLILLALIINGTFRLRREVDAVRADWQREADSLREDRAFWQRRAEELEERFQRWADENHERAERDHDRAERERERYDTRGNE